MIISSHLSVCPEKGFLGPYWVLCLFVFVCFLAALAILRLNGSSNFSLFSHLQVVTYNSFANLHSYRVLGFLFLHISAIFVISYLFSGNHLNVCEQKENLKETVRGIFSTSEKKLDSLCFL